jgi:hypothetical protein
MARQESAKRLLQNDSSKYDPSVQHIVDEYLENSRKSFLLLRKRK